MKLSSQKTHELQNFMFQLIREGLYTLSNKLNGRILLIQFTVLCAEPIWLPLRPRKINDKMYLLALR
jgi:hypothetical protein